MSMSAAEFQHGSLQNRLFTLSSYYSALVAVGLAAFLIFFGLGSYSLMDNNEGLYAEISREMLKTHSFITPHLNGVPYLEKPPLFYWLITLSYLLLGTTEFAARLVPALSALCTLLALLWLGAKNGRRSDGSLAALILGSSLGFIAMARTVLFDMLLTAFLSWALVLFFQHFRSKGQTYLRWSAAALGLAIMTKGIVALALYLLVAGSYVVIRRRTITTLRTLMDPGALLVLFAITVPWYLVMAVENKDFLWFYFINDNLLRFFDMRIPHDYHTGSWYYYLPRITFGLFPWTLFLPLVRFRLREAGEGDRDESVFFWVWLLASLTFLSLSAAKGDYYILVGLPALAGILSMTLNRLPDSPRQSRILALLAGMIVVVIAAGLIVMHGEVNDSERMAFLFGDRFSLFIAVGSASAIILAAVLLFASQSRKWGFYAIAISCMPMVFLLLSVVIRAEPWFSSHRMADYLNESEEKRPVFLYRDFETVSALPFYLRSQLRLIDSISSDLAYGSAHDDGKGRFIASHLFVDLTRTEKVFVIVTDTRLNEFQSLAFDARLFPLKHIGRTILYSSSEPSIALAPLNAETSPPRRATNGVSLF